MAGKYIINQTAGSRVVILEENDESIQGGYFDKEGVWHDLEGPLDGSLEGRYVINETDGKRVVLLEEDAEKIGGGYFEAAGTWVPFGSSAFYLDVSKFEIIGLSNAVFGENIYTSTRSDRLSYKYFDIPIEGGYKYKITVESTINTANFGYTFYNETAMSAVEKHATIQSADTYDQGWQEAVTEIEVPATVKNSPIVCMRITSRASSSNPTITENYIKSVKIERGEAL